MSSMVATLKTNLEIRRRAARFCKNAAHSQLSIRSIAFIPCREAGFNPRQVRDGGAFDSTRIPRKTTVNGANECNIKKSTNADNAHEFD